jgi:anti-anti-sigma regulatory factor
MINTTKYQNIKETLIHRITGEITTEEVKIGIDELVKSLDKAIQKRGTTNLIIDAKGVHFKSLLAHKLFSQGLTTVPVVKEKIHYCAIILDDSPNARAEKELMDNERLKFFFDFGEGVTWLQDKTGGK